MHIFFSILDDKLFGENHWCARNVYFLWFYLYTFCGDSLQTGARNSWKILQRLSSCQKSSRKRNNIPIASTSSLMKKELTNQNWVSWLFFILPSISHPIHLYWIFEKSSLMTWIFSLQKSISKLIFAGYTVSKNPVRNRLKIQFVELDFSKRSRGIRESLNGSGLWSICYNPTLKTWILDYDSVN